MTNSQSYIPKHSLIIYGIGENFYVEIADFKDTTRGYEPGTYHALDMETIKRLGDTFHKVDGIECRLRGLMPPDILYMNTNPAKFKLIWRIPACKRKLFFKDNLNIPSGEVWLPELIFQLKQDDLYVFAIYRNKLYRAPFHNVNDSGKVCMGNVKLKEDLEYVEDIMYDFEKGFFNSYFSETHGKPINGNINQFWKRAVQSKEKLNYKALLPLKIQIEDLINDKKRG